MWMKSEVNLQMLYTYPKNEISFDNIPAYTFQNQFWSRL